MDSFPPPTESRLLQRLDEYVRREPTKAIVSGFGAGFLLNLLPLAALTGLVVSLAFALVRPVLLFLGLLKACELCRLNPQTELKND